MLRKVQQIIIENATGKKVLLIFILTQIIYGVMVFFTIPKIHKYSNGMKILDLMPTGYSADYVQKLFETLGEKGCSIYLFQQIPLDLIYPGLFAISFSLLLTFIFRKSFSKENKIQKMNLLPFFSGFFDYMENMGIIIMLITYPDFQTWMANTTSVFSIIKSVLTVIVFVLLVIGFVGIYIKKRKSIIG